MTKFFLGLDAGNSKTVALIADHCGRILGRGRGGVGDIYGAPTEAEAVREVLYAVHAALDAASLLPTQINQAAFRLAGIDWVEDERYWRETLAAQLPELGPLSLKNDGFALLRCGRPDGVGVAITAGSGPAVAARGRDGREYGACWWSQHPLGGRGLGESAFRAVVDAEIDLGPPTALTRELLDLFGYPDVKAMLYAFTRRGGRPSRDKWAAARSVVRLAGDKDAVAMAITGEQARNFAGLARIAARRTGLGAGGAVVPVVVGGSILTSEHPAYREALIAALGEEVGPVAVAISSASPVSGALLDAMAESGMTIGQDVHDRVLMASHPADFLLT